MKNVNKIKQLVFLAGLLFFSASSLADTNQCIVIPDGEVVDVFSGVKLSSLDSKEMQVGVRSDPEYLYFTPDTTTNRSLNVVTQGGFAYEVKEGTVLRIADDKIGQQATALTYEDGAGCAALAALGSAGGTPIVGRIVGGALLAYIIFKDDDDDATPVTTVEPTTVEPTTTTTTVSTEAPAVPVGRPNFCDILGCGNCDSFMANRCDIKVNEKPDRCGCPLASQSL